MRLLFSFLITGLITTSAFAADEAFVQFKNGNNIEVEQLSGSVIYNCTDNMGHHYTRHWFCNADLVSPGTHDYIVSNEPIDADKVTLTSTRADGEVKTKTVAYNSEKSISKNRFNLIIKTITQTPLLSVGNNSVAFQFTKGKNVVSAGTFVSTVTNTGKTQCKARTAFAQNSNQCEVQSMGCDYYFYLENNCQY